MIVDVNEVERCLRYFKAINDADIKDIIWIRGAEKLHVDPVAIEEFAFIGLSNRDFPAVAGWLPEDIGIRVVSLALTKAPNAKVSRGAEAPEESAAGQTSARPLG